MNNRKNNLFIILAGIFITNAVLAEIIGVKIFSLEKTFGFSLAQIQLLGVRYDFNLTAGVIIWPVIFIFTDIINEYFGKSGVRKITYLTTILIAYTYIVLYLVSKTAPADFWLEINKTINGNPFNIEDAYDRIFSQSMGIILGSLVAFLVSQFLDVHVFRYLRKITGSKYIWLRATGSTLVSQLIDSFIVLVIAFRLFAGEYAWSWGMLLSVCFVNYIYKFAVAVLLTPALYGIHYIIEKYLGKEEANRLAEEAA
ncbi:MAG: hypothetical protein A3H98_13200 [Bacteroidetes bacterium RIFCSPLOWO2_02_FULL_36_8]|nr:MAG: hypothetical protein A3H98_13200 [Bacteroidetes bacterium RIFCSPLOWO2_02_FULL_36_8]OFY69964.1 MAG: hypothetical protein A3G23_05775 [Bacteroidetes bacterium RIFCSPLOWO2_12_FULL_37_12]